MFLKLVLIELNCFSVCPSLINHPELSEPIAWKYAALHSTNTISVRKEFNTYSYQIPFKFFRFVFVVWFNDNVYLVHYKSNCKIFCFSMSGDVNFINLCVLPWPPFLFFSTNTVAYISLKYIFLPYYSRN